MKMNVSGIKTYLGCQKKAYYSIDLKRGKADMFSPAFTIGTWWHSLMEAKLKGVEPDIPTLTQAAVASVPPNKLSAVLNQMAALELGYKVWTPPVDWKVKSVEQVYEAVIPRWLTGIAPATAHGVKGIVDALVEWNGLWWHVQHKTIGKNISLPTYWQKMVTDWHECIYEYILQQNGFTPYGGTLLLTARKMSYKDAEVMPQAIVQHQFLTRSPKVVERAVNDVLSILTQWQTQRDLVPITGGPAAFISNLDACFGPYGNKACPYLNVCHNGEDIMDETKYVTIADRYDDLNNDLE